MAAVSLTACEADGLVIAETAADAVQPVRDPSEDRWIVAATEPHSCSAAADGFGFTQFEACSDASAVTPVIFVEFGFSQKTCARAADVTFAVSPPARSDAPDRLITIDLECSDECTEPVSGVIAAGRIDLSNASEADASRTLLARRAVDQQRFGPPVLLLYDAQTDTLVPRKPPTASDDARPSEG